MMHLKEGEKAPEFSGKNQEGSQVSLSDFRGEKVILYFYPKDDTPGCTAEACDLRDNYEKLRKEGYKVIGVSTDDVESHKKFAAKYNLPFDLIADTDQKIVEAYGVYGEKIIFGKKKKGINRTTFVIDENGKIEEVIRKVKTKEHSAQIMGQ